MNEEALLTELIAMLPSPTYIVISIVFGVIGLMCFQAGRKVNKPRLKWGGLALMFYPYLIGNDTRLLILVGLALCALLYFWRKS
ncbi:hypothetical protein H8K33_12615 [Undibacterium amnicola]|uniref:Amino acid transport protein n=1 Tax=Undibacterium amnicola TaxID=1834038 RepID=A0ABR6XTN4_9BURK|nr:hypothetical protein [Undibacterium amnicola]MBC3832359.1 hypothetical protein [Undibacterium amnicola]